MRLRVWHIDEWLHQRLPRARHDAIAANATEMAGSAVDLVTDLESAAVEHLLELGLKPGNPGNEARRDLLSWIWLRAQVGADRATPSDCDFSQRVQPDSSMTVDDRCSHAGPGEVDQEDGSPFTQ